MSEKILNKIYSKIKCKIIDIPIVFTCFLLLLLFMIKYGGLIINKVSFVNNGIFFPLISLLANLFLLKIIQIVVIIKNIRFSKTNLYVMFTTFFAVSVYYLITLSKREFIYYWDFSNYLVMQYTLENEFSCGIVNGLFALIRSFAQDYTKFINLFTEFPFCFTPKTGNWYVFVQLFNIFIPILVLLSSLVIKIQEIFHFADKNLNFTLLLSTAACFPLLHKSALLGQPDWLGIIFCLIIILLTLDYRFEKPDLLLYIILFLSTGCLIVTRRWYMYFIVGYYTLYGLTTLIDIVKKYHLGQKNQAYTQFKSIAVFGIVSVLIMSIVFFKLFMHIFSYNYGKRYASYMNGGFTSECIHQMKLLGLLCILIMAVGIGYIIIKNETRSIIFISLFGMLISMFLFTRIQNMGYHQSLMLLPYYYILLITGLSVLLNTHKKTCKISLSCATCLLLINVFVNCIDSVRPTCLFSDCNITVESRKDMQEIRQISRWIEQNCAPGESAYIIPHDTSYNPDIFRNVFLPDMNLREKISYGSAVLGTHAFPTELLDAKYILTCMPFSSGSAETAQLSVKYDQLFSGIKNAKFQLVNSFDMKNGTVFYIYERVRHVDMKEINYYLEALKEEDSLFPDLFSNVLNTYVQDHLEDWNEI